MPIKLLRFADLRAMGFVRNWPQLDRMQERHGFPVGRLISSNCRVWTEEEVEKWLEHRPVAKAPLRGAILKKRQAAIAKAREARRSRKAKTEEREVA
jgi:predicted DNA-binding transcriptional regulator AlpA